jgi:hypothetical protein
MHALHSCTKIAHKQGKHNGLPNKQLHFKSFGKIAALDPPADIRDFAQYEWILMMIVASTCYLIAICSFVGAMIAWNRNEKYVALTLTSCTLLLFNGAIKYTCFAAALRKAKNTEEVCSILRPLSGSIKSIFKRLPAKNPTRRDVTTESRKGENV